MDLDELNKKYKDKIDGGIYHAYSASGYGQLEDLVSDDYPFDDNTDIDKLVRAYFDSISGGGTVKAFLIKYYKELKITDSMSYYKRFNQIPDDIDFESIVDDVDTDILTQHQAIAYVFGDLENMGIVGELLRLDYSDGGVMINNKYTVSFTDGSFADFKQIMNYDHGAGSFEEDAEGEMAEEFLEDLESSGEDIEDFAKQWNEEDIDESLRSLFKI